MSNRLSATWFRSFDYGYIHRGVCLWWAILGDGRLHIAREYVHQRTSIGQTCEEIHRITHELGIERVRYTVADKYSMGHYHYASERNQGETRGDLFAHHGIPITTTDHDRHQGWTRVREFLALRPDGVPWLTIEPSCRFLIRTLASAVSAKHDPEDVEEFDGDDAIQALRYGAMSRPVPLVRTPLQPKPGTAGHLLEQARRGVNRDPYKFHSTGR